MCDYCDSRQSAWERYYNKRPAQTTDEDGIRAQEAFSMGLRHSWMRRLGRLDHTSAFRNPGRIRVGRMAVDFLWAH